MVKPSKRAKRHSFGSTPKCPIDTGLAKLGTPHDFRDGGTISPAFTFSITGSVSIGLGQNLVPAALGLVDSIPLALAANIVLELGNQRQSSRALSFAVCQLERTAHSPRPRCASSGSIGASYVALHRWRQTESLAGSRRSDRHRLQPQDRVRSSRPMRNWRGHEHNR